MSQREATSETTSEIKEQTEKRRVMCMKKPCIFFSHSLTIYNTDIEAKCLELISIRYPSYAITNPRDIVMDVSITAASSPTEQFLSEMETYFLPLVRQSDMLVYYKDDSYSPGVDMEIVEAEKRGVPIIKLEL